MKASRHYWVNVVSRDHVLVGVRGGFTQVSIRLLIEALDFISNKKRWGFPLMRGLFEIGEKDFNRLARAMQVDLTAL